VVSRGRARLDACPRGSTLPQRSGDPYGAGVRGPLSDDDIEMLEANARTPKAHRKAAATLEAWATESHPDDETSPAAMLTAAAEHLQRAGDRDEALAVLRRSATAPGDVPPDKRCYLHSGLLGAGLHEEARQLAEEVRRSAPSEPDVYSFMAENYELTGDLQQALRWLTIGLRHVELPTDADELEEMAWQSTYLLRARRRVREALGFPPDELDELVPPREPLDLE
jgi:tetratricopeptide (TPR) repeat protein